MDHQISAKRRNLIIINNNKRKRTCRIVDFAVPADYRVKVKEYEKGNKHLDLAKELKMLRNKKVTYIPIVIGAHRTVTKGLINGLEDLDITERVETIQTTALLKMAKIQRKVLET